MNYSNETWHDMDVWYTDFYELSIAFKILHILYLIVGFVLNLWQFCALITSADVRSSMRNKLILSTCILHISECVFKLPLLLAENDYDVMHCGIFTAYFTVAFMQDFVANWSLVLMVLIYIFQIVNLKLTEGLTNLGTKIMSATYLLSPWILSLATLSILSNHRDTILFYTCIIPVTNLIYKIADTVVPTIVAVLLLVLAYVKKGNRLIANSSSTSQQRELIANEINVDETTPYIAAVAVSTLCDAMVVISIGSELITNDIYTQLIVSFVAHVLTESRPISMALTWFLFEDIRARMKTWRLCYRPQAAIDLTVTIETENSR